MRTPNETYDAYTECLEFLHVSWLDMYVAKYQVVFIASCNWETYVYFFLSTVSFIELEKSINEAQILK